MSASFFLRLICRAERGRDLQFMKESSIYKNTNRDEATI
jgi:hypothetical protein